MSSHTTTLPDGKIEMLRHSVATLAYRAGKALRGAPPEFSDFDGAAPQTPGRLLAHLCDLLDWAIKLADGVHEWKVSQVGLWEADVARFFAGLAALDHRLASAPLVGCDAGRLFQGPVADALTHVGQVAMLRRLAGCPIKGENYFVAQVSTGRVGLDQEAPRREF